VLDNTDGFTITELLIAIVVGSALAMTVMSISLFFFSDLMRSQAEANLTLESQNLLNTTVNDLKVAANIRDSNLITDSNNPSGWNTSNPNHILIVSTPALDSSNEFIIDTSQGEPYMNERIYFETNGVLYRRTLADPLAVGNSAKTTCPSELSSESCPADAQLTESFDDMTFIMYDQNNVVTTITSAARSVEMNVVMSRQAFGNNITSNNTTRVTMRNP